MQLELWILLRLVAAGACGALVGFERQQTGKRAGLRTHMLVAIGAAMFVSANDFALEEARLAARSGNSEARFQVGLMSPVQAVATGIGFLGAGTIFTGGRRNEIHGLTTAASIWGISGVGVVVGFDRYLLALGATALILFVLHVVARLEPPHHRDLAPAPGGSDGQQP